MDEREFFMEFYSVSCLTGIGTLKTVWRMELFMVSGFLVNILAKF